MSITEESAIAAVQQEATTVADENAFIVDAVVAKAGISWPLSSTQTMLCATAAEYEISRQRLDYILSLGVFEPPQKMLGRLAWSRQNVVDLLRFLENKRSFLPFSERHTPKLTRGEQAKQNQAIAEVAEIESELKKQNSNQLMNTICMADSLHIRLLCRQILDRRAKEANK